MRTFQWIFVFLILTFWLGCESGDKSKSASIEIDNSGAVMSEAYPKAIHLPPKHYANKRESFSRDSKDDLSFDIDKYIKKMKKAKMMFNPPQEMVVNSTHVMKLVIDLGKSFDELKENFKHNAALSKREIKVSDLIEVKLSGTAFKIKPITPEKQHISKIETTTWEWSVTPQQVGEQELQLVVTAIFTKGNGKEISTLKTFDETIKVKSLPMIEQVKNFFASEYKWLFATFFIPIFLWFMKKRKKTKDNKENNE